MLIRQVRRGQRVQTSEEWERENARHDPAFLGGADHVYSTEPNRGLVHMTSSTVLPSGETHR